MNLREPMNNAAESPTCGESLPVTQAAACSESRKLERRSWRNWLLLAGMSIITTIGLTTAIPPLMSNHIENVWPWVNTDLVLLATLSLSMAVLVGYLTHTERRLVAMRRRFEQLQEEGCERATRNYSRALGLFNVTRMIGTKTNLQGVFNSITKTCMESFDCQRASLMIFDKQTGELVLRSGTGHQNPVDLIGARQRIGEGVAGWVAANRKPVLIRTADDIERYPGLEFVEQYSASSMVVPIIVGDELVGVLSVSSDSPELDYDEEDLRILWVYAENAGTCIRQTKQVDWINQTIRLTNACPRFNGTCRPSTRDLLSVENIAETCRRP